MHQAANSLLIGRISNKGWGEETQDKDLLLHRYLNIATKKLLRFKEFEIAHVPREENTRVAVLSQLNNTVSPLIDHSFIQETRKCQASNP